MGSFKSYVGLEEYEMKVAQRVNGVLPLQPKFYPGELVISEAHNVLKFTSLSKKKGISGSLFVTNARLIFVSSDGASSEDSTPLLSINTICQYEEPRNSSGGKRAKKRLKMGPSNSPNNSSMFYSGTTRIHEILVICSNFRTIHVSFKFSPIDHGGRIVNSILHHAFPDKIERLFFFDFTKALENVDNHESRNGQYSSKFVGSSGGNPFLVPNMNLAGDWLREIKITRTSGFRITSINECFATCQTLPEFFVVPVNVNDGRLGSLSEKLKGNRPPFWVWGDSRGGCIIRMGKLNSESDSSAESVFFESLRKSDPLKRQPLIIDLEDAFPIKELRNSFTKLLDLCIPESFSHFEETDSRFLSSLDQTKWLTWITKIIHLSSEIAESLYNRSEIIILQENEARDVSCIISSIVQIIIDARFRTVIGLFSLIEKEWVATGHPFHSSYMHASPLFLLFLDTIHQLMYQNPYDFEYGDQLLAEIWDTTFDSTISTFLFDSIGQKLSLEPKKELTFWYRILTKERADNEKDQTLMFDKLSVKPIKNDPSLSIPRVLLNPLFKLRPLLFPPSMESQTITPRIPCSASMADLDFWSFLYLERTMEATPIASALRNSISELGTANSPLPDSTTPNSKGSGGGSPFQTTSFIFSSGTALGNSNRIDEVKGRDSLLELKLVDLLISASSSTTRYQRNPAGGTGMAPTYKKSPFNVYNNSNR